MNIQAAAAASLPVGTAPAVTGVPMLLYVSSIFLSAFLAFQIQPLIARTILPWFGGTPAVWSCVMLFFQSSLTGGYAYAMWLAERVPGRLQGRVHLLVVGASFAVIAGLSLGWPSPVTPGLEWKPTGVEWPTARIFGILTLAVGLPYFTLATNSPLLQAWFSREFPARSPYWLYAISNVGSLLALATYPLGVEPLFTIREQGWLWAACYAVFVVLTGFAALRNHAEARAITGDSESRGAAIQSAAPSWFVRSLWVSLSAAASMMLLAVTNHLTQEVAVIPFLWVLPLGLYLLTFILTFSGAKRYHRPLFGALLLLVSAACIYMTVSRGTPILWQVVGFSAALFVACMVAHGELYRLRPETAHLTRFYMMVSVGGALGGIVVNLLAPALFTGFWELYIGWAAIWLLLAVMTFVRPTVELPSRWRNEHNAVVGGLAVAAMIAAGFAIVASSRDDVVRARNFYGVLSVRHDPERQLYSMVHGTTLHGSQFHDSARRGTATTYFWRGSGIGLALANHPARGRAMRVGVLGLGVGTLAAYGRSGDTYRFYEINPLVVSLAKGEGGFFSFLRDSAADVQVVVGDARISLNQELAAGSLQHFDLLALDVFSSDAIPAHLLTREAFAVYLKHLAPGGIVAANISNRYLDLTPVLWQVAKEYRLKIASVSVPAPANELSARPSVWVLLARDGVLLTAPAIRDKADRLKDYVARTRLWTDDYTNLFQVLK